MKKQTSLLTFFKSAVKETQNESNIKSSDQSTNNNNSQKSMPPFINSVDIELLQATSGKRLKKVIDSDEEEFKISELKDELPSSFLDEVSHKKKVYDKSAGRAKSNAKDTKFDNTNIIQEKKDDQGKFNLFEQLQEIVQDFDDTTPIWARLGESRDKQMKLHGTDNGDPTTLYIPPEDQKKFTQAMKQFWKIKSENFDKVIFFKLGKFYELFYDDAMIGHKELDLNWMGRKMHTGFPEKVLGKYSKLLVERGYKIAVVDQTETPEQMNKRVSENKKSGVGGTSDKVVNRELTQVMTRGTFQNDDPDRKGIEDERILMCIKKQIISLNKEVYGIVILESQTNRISLAEINNSDDSFLSLKTLFLQCKPLEVVINPNNIRKYDPIQKIFSSIQTQKSYLHEKNDNWDGRKAIHLFGEQVPKSVIHFQDSPVVLDALQGLFSYLDTILIKQKVLESARFQVYDADSAKQIYMMLDSQSLYHLEVLQSSTFGNNMQDYSLFGCVDRTVSPGGKRLLKRWVCAPLYDIRKIVDRQDAVEDLLRFAPERDKLRIMLKKIPDLERLCSRTYAYSVKTSSKAVFYEDISTMKLKEFRQLCNSLRILDFELKIFSKISTSFKSDRLQRLLKTVDEVSDADVGYIYEQENDEQIGLLPNIQANLDEFEKFIIWKNDTPYPVQGILQSYDNSEIFLQNIKDQLQGYLDNIRVQLKDKSIQFANAKYRYEIEVPQHLVQDHKPKDWEFTSSKQGYQRFHTKEIKDFIYDLERAEEDHKIQLNSFVQFVFNHFQQNYRIWDRFISIVNEIDVLCALSIWSQNADGFMCRPLFKQNNKPHLQIDDGRHPCLTMLGLNYVPNSISLGSDSENTTFLLLTGPNMGGKSTTLRMVCINVILAQMGAYVPARRMELSPVDRIFTRIGAKDSLMEGKSTFHIELEETMVALKQATSNSLFITDELGRGTSTYDGVAIAYSVMKFMAQRVKCLVIFATHFRVLVEEAKQMKGIKNFHMACYIEVKCEKVVFLYKLKEGPSPASFGINVAKVTGIPKEIILKAQEKANHFENKIGLQAYQDTMKKFNQIIGNM